MIFIRYFDSIYSADLPHRAKAVYMYLHDRANGKGECWPGINTIAADLGVSRSTVQRAIEDLKRSGYLEVKQRWRDNGGRSSLLFRLLK